MIEILKQKIEVFQKGEIDLVSDKFPEFDSLISRLPLTKKEGYSLETVRDTARLLSERLRMNSLAFLVIPSLKDDKLRPWKIINAVTSTNNIEYIDSIIWMKDKFIPIQGDKRLNNVYETILVFAKGKNYHLDRDALLRYVDPVTNKKCVGNVWNINLQEREVLPKELVRSCLLMQNLLPNSLVVDPFLEKGDITAEVAREMGHSFYGIRK